MKKGPILLLVVLILSLIQITEVKAQCPPGDARCILAQEFGLNQSQIPTSKAELSQFYLKERWNKIIESNKILGPINSLFKKLSWLFIILFHHPYEISLLLITIVIFWFFFASLIAICIETFTGLKGIYSFWLGIISVIIFSWIPPNSKGVIEMIAQANLDLIFNQENWWIRLIIVMTVLVMIALSIRAARTANKFVKEKNKEELAKKQQEQYDKIKKFEKGAGLSS